MSVDTISVSEQEQAGKTKQVVASCVEPAILDIRPVFAAGGSPCGMIDEAVSNLIPGQSLVLLAPFEPRPLFTKLGKLGFTAVSEPCADGSWRIEFKPGVETLRVAPGSLACGCGH